MFFLWSGDRGLLALEVLDRFSPVLCIGIGSPFPKDTESTVVPLKDCVALSQAIPGEKVEKK